MLTKKELDKIRKALPKGGYAELSKRTGYDSSMVGKTLRNPNNFNELIIKEALELIKEEKAKVDELKKQIKEVVSC